MARRMGVYFRSMHCGQNVTPELRLPLSSGCTEAAGIPATSALSSTHTSWISWCVADLSSPAPSTVSPTKRGFLPKSTMSRLLSVGSALGPRCWASILSASRLPDFLQAHTWQRCRDHGRLPELEGES